MFHHAKSIFGAWAIVALVLLAAAVPAVADEAPASLLLWQIGAFDDDSRDFANAPGSYGNFEATFPQGPVYVVGRSSPESDWNYIHPGPADAWAGNKDWPFVIEFDLAEDVAPAAPLAGEALLWIDLIGAHPQAPPVLKVTLNGEELAVIETEPGNNVPVYADPAGGQEQILAVAFAAEKLLASGNRLVVHNVGGSWVVYDALKLELFPGGVPEGYLPQKEDPFAGVTPRVLPGMVVVTPTPASTGEKALILSLQGLVNQDLGRLFVGSRGDEWYSRAVAFSDVTLSITSPYKVLEAFRSYVNGIVIYDPQLPDTLNVAFTLAGIEGAVVTNAQIAQELQREPLQLPVLWDLRGRFATALEAYTWAYETLWGKVNRDVFVNLDPGMLNMQDLLVARKGFAVRLDADVPEEAALLERMFADLAPGGSVYGWPPTDSAADLRLASAHGLSYVVTDWSTNLSIYTQGIPPVLVQSPAPPAVGDPGAGTGDSGNGDGAITVTFLMDHGDIFHYNQFHLANVWKDPARGQVPLAWTIHPRLAELAPGIINHYYKTAAGDLFIAPAHLGGTGALEAVPDPHAFGAAHRDVLAAAGIEVAWLAPMSGGGVLSAEDEARLVQIAEGAGLKAVFYGRSVEPGGSPRVVGGVTLVPVLYTQGGETPAQLAERIAQAAMSSQGYVAVGVDTWSYGPGYVKEAADVLAETFGARILRADAWLAVLQAELTE